MIDVLINYQDHKIHINNSVLDFGVRVTNINANLLVVQVVTKITTIIVDILATIHIIMAMHCLLLHLAVNNKLRCLVVAFIVVYFKQEAAQEVATYNYSFTAYIKASFVESDHKVSLLVAVAKVVDHPLIKALVNIASLILVGLLPLALLVAEINYLAQLIINILVIRNHQLMEEDIMAIAFLTFTSMD